MPILRGYVFIDSLQSQLASCMGSFSNGFLPVSEMASLFIEIEPGIFINRLTDVALKATNVKPSIQVVEREFGLLEIHSEDKGDVLLAGKAILDFIKTDKCERCKPQILTNEIIRGITAQHAQIINKERNGSMIIEGESLFILETEPAAYVSIAANEAEKAAKVKLIDIKFYGAYGRLYLSGSEAEIDSASEAALRALEKIDGKTL